MKRDLPALFFFSLHRLLEVKLEGDGGWQRARRITEDARDESARAHGLEAAHGDHSAHDGIGGELPEHDHWRVGSVAFDGGPDLFGTGGN